MRWFSLFALLLFTLGLDAAARPYEQLVHLFDYDPKAPLDLQEKTVSNRNGVQMHDITYASSKGGRVPAYLVVPEGRGPFAGIVFMHWGLGNRSAFLAEALMLAPAGAVSILIDAPWARPEPWRTNYDQTWEKPESDRNMYIQTVVDLRRAVDLLQARKDVDPNRIGFVGLSFGAHMGGILSGIDKRFKTFVLMGGLPRLTDLYRKSDRPEDVELRKTMPRERFEKYIETTEPLDAVYYIGHAAPSSIFFQFAREDQYIPQWAATEYVQAASEPKLEKYYSGGHELNELEALIDRDEWLSQKLGLSGLKSIFQKKLNLAGAAK